MGRVWHRGGVARLFRYRTRRTLVRKYCSRVTLKIMRFVSFQIQTDMKRSKAFSFAIYLSHTCHKTLIVCAIPQPNHR
jgi:hypothetical protein